MLSVMPRPGLAKRAASYEDLMKVPDHLVAEILEGELYATRTPCGPSHTQDTSTAQLLHDPLQRLLD